MAHPASISLCIGLFLATGSPLFAQSAAVTAGGKQDGDTRPYPFGVFRLDALNNFGPDTRGWNILTPQGSYPGPANLDPSRSRYGLPPLGSEDDPALPAAPQPSVNPG